MKDHFPRALWSVWDNCVRENILVFIMFEPTLPAKTSISSLRAGFCGIVSLDFISKYPCFLTNTEKKVSSGIVVCRFSTCVRLFSSVPRRSTCFKKRERARIVFPRLLPTCCVGLRAGVYVGVCYARYALLFPSSRPPLRLI